MIPLENRNLLIKRLKEGWDIRNASKMAQITRSNLYKYFKEMPAFRQEVDKVIATVLARKEKKDKLDERRSLMKIKEIVRKM